MKEVSFRDDVLPLKDKIFRLALRMSLNRAEAEDIVQDVLMRAWDRRGELATLESPEAWCLTVCRNLSLDRARLADNRNAALPDNLPERIGGEAPDQEMIRAERIRNVGRMIDRLPEAQRTAMQLRDIEGKTYKEIAGITGQSEEQVKVNIFRARKRVREQIEKTENYGL